MFSLKVNEQVLWLLLAVATGVFGFFHGSRTATTAASLTHSNVVNRSLAAQAELAEKNRELEYKLGLSANAAAEAYEKGKTDAKQKEQRLVADLRSGAVRMRKLWETCEASKLPRASSGAGELDAGTRDREESAARIVRAAAECDARIRSLQQVLNTDREILNDTKD
jgi:hypothetical protein